VMGIPMGTVMSSLSRARQALRRALDYERKQTGSAARRQEFLSVFGDQ